MQPEYQPLISYGSLPFQPINMHLQYLMAKAGISNGRMPAWAFVRAISSVPLDSVRSECRHDVQVQINIARTAYHNAIVSIRNFSPNSPKLEAFVNTTFEEMRNLLQGRREPPVQKKTQLDVQTWMDVDASYYGAHSVRDILLAVAKHSYETAIPRGLGVNCGPDAPSQEIDFKAYLEHDALGQPCGLCMDYVQGRDCRTLVVVEGTKLSLHAYSFEQRKVTLDEFINGIRKESADRFMAEVKGKLK